MPSASRDEGPISTGAVPCIRGLRVELEVQGGTRLLRQGRKQDKEQKTRKDRRIQPEKAADRGGGGQRGRRAPGRATHEQGSACARHREHRLDTGAGVLAGSPALQTGGPGEGGSGAALDQPQTQNHHTTHAVRPMHLLPGGPVGLSLRAFKCFHTHTKGKEQKI